MLKFVSSYLALGYLAFATLFVAGVFQMLAASRSITGLALLDYRRPGLWRRALGPLLIVAAFAWFFGTRREILTPGPAGLELTLLFGASVVLALILTLLGASILRPFRRPLEQASAQPGVEAQEVRLNQGTPALLYRSGNPEQPRPGVCLVADPCTPQAQLHTLVNRLVQQGLVVVQPLWGASAQEYPDALALVPSCMAFLSSHEAVDARRLGVLGTHLGGDLALRAAASDGQIRAVAALAPLIEERNAQLSLGLLHEMTFAQALRWRMGGHRLRLIRQLRPSEALATIAPRRALVMYGGLDPLVPVADLRPRLERESLATEVRIVPHEGHLSLIQSRGVGTIIAAQWLAECLAKST